MTGSDIGLLFRAKGDTSDAKKAFNDLEQSIKKDTRQIEQDVEKSSSGAGASFNDLGEKVDDLGTQFSTVSGVVGAATVVIAAAGAAAVIVGKQLFDMARGAGEAGAEIDKFQKLTSLSVESIQALKIASEQAGGSLEDIEETWESFSELMVEAARGEEDAIAKLKQNGIDHKEAVKDLEGTYAKALKIIAEMPPGLKQNAAAMDLMGESGLRMINVTKAMGGDLAEYTKKLKENGAIMDADGIRKAKEFDLFLTKLSQQFTGLKNNIGLGVIPEVVKLGETISSVVKENQNDIVLLGKATILVFGDILRVGGQAVALIKTYKSEIMGIIEIIKTIDPLSRAAFNYGKDLRGRVDQQLNVDAAENAARAAAETQLGDTRFSGALPDEKKRQEDAEKRKKDREAALKKELDLVLEYNRLEIEAVKQKFDMIENVTIDDLRDLQVNVANLMSDAFIKSSANLKGQEFENAKKKFDNDVLAWSQSIDKQKKELREKEANEEKKATEDRLKLAERYAERDLALSKNRADQSLTQLDALHNKGLLKEDLYQKGIAAIKLTQLRRDKEINESLLEELEKGSEKYQQVLTKILELDTQIKRQVVDNTKAVTEAVNEAVTAHDEFFQNLENKGAPGEEGAPAPDEGPAGGGGIFGAIDWQGEADVIAGIGDILTNTFHQIAEAVGSAVEAFVLFGSAGASFQKFAAQLIASIAKMAAIEAVWNLAQGFAKLAMAFFGHPMAGPSAAMHFKAAAIYGIISGVAAVAGRAVAGDAFKSQTSGAFGSSASSSASSGNGGDVYSSNRDKQIIAMSRNAPAAAPETNIVIRDNSGLFAEFFSVEVSRNGKVRDAIKTVTD